MRKPQKPVPDVPKSNPMRAKVPCVVCGDRLSEEEKKTHNCWSPEADKKPGFQG